MTTRVYGCSDDLIEFDGDFREEIDGSEEPTFLIFSDGTVAEIHYGKNDDGIWAINVIKAGTLFDRLELCFNADAPIYSDQLFFKEGIKHVYRTNELELIK